MPIASITCSPAFATSATGTTIYYTYNFQKGKVYNSNPYQNSSYVAFSPGVVNYNNKTIYNSIAPIYNGFSDISNSSACTINNITVSFFGALPSGYNVPENFKILCYNSAGMKKIEFSIPGAPTNTDTSAIDGKVITTSSAQITRIITGTFNPSDFLNQDNFYKIEFYVPQNTNNDSGFILRGQYNNVNYKFTIEIDYNEPPKPSFTNAPVLRVNNVTSSTSYTANLSWTKATLNEGFESYQNSVIYLILENGNQIDSTSSLSYTYTKQSSSQILLAIKPSLTYLGTQYTGDSSNLVSYTFTPFKAQPSNLLVNGEIESHYYQCKLNWTAAQVIDGYSVSYELFINDVYSGDATSTSYTWDDGSSLAPRKTFKIIAYASNGTLDFYSSYTNSVSYTYIPNGLVKATTLDSYQAYSTSWDGAQEPTIIAWYFNKGDTVYVDLNNRKYHDGYYLCYNTNGLAGYIVKIYLDIPKNTLYYYNNGWQFCYVYRYNGTKWEPCIVYYYVSPSEGWKQCQ